MNLIFTSQHRLQQEKFNFTQIEDKSPNYWHLLIVPRVILFNDACAKFVQQINLVYPTYGDILCVLEQTEILASLAAFWPSLPHQRLKPN